ncbi:PAB-dependent poly(A)-specific ribonuclease subunit PAN2 [Daldinia childiae]|uniref:PAB-dependent poly(A)-specific ribonuclease subunit PAN2 n=1 Tax=Daldinia childiae TaxID=326645 RepID=UPI0014450BF9|nr:PAB-dependent poly(A)-specific ribonuclease subunit PAN2 [Daldinia childiae]KAF3054959.1 PAB-dependent poly(A)-specific ribonuclease subunit PAN2 [Daldinia childiae]
MSFTSKGTAEILAAGEQDKMFVIDINKGEITKQLPTEYKYTIMRRSRYICAATSTGAVHIIDPVSFQVIKIWNAHTAAINDMDAQHDFIVTCGYSMRHGGNYMPDPFVNVFDLKNMISMSPIPFPAGAAYVRMHPRMSTTSIVMSQIGQMHVVDLMNPNTSNVRQANNLSYFSMIEIASSGEAIALADADCYIHLWGSPSKIHFAEFPTPIETADSGTGPRIEFDSPDAPLSAVEIGAPPVKIDAQFLATLQERDWGYFGKNTRPLRRNQIEDTRNTENAQSSLKPPKFLSEKAREAAKSPAGTPAPEEVIPEIPQILQDNKLESLKIEVPELYQNIEIKYSKFGIDDFDFGYFNKTQYSGLQNHIVNAYANPLLQVMHYTPLIRNIALHHAATACVDELCLLCELGFLFDMLYKAEGEACQASNFTKTLSYHPEAGKLGLLEEEPHASRTVMLQHLARYLLRQMTQNYNLMIQNPHSHSTESPRPGALEEHRRLWATPGWLPEEIGVIVDNGQFFCFEGEDLKLHLQRGIHNISVYSLTGLAVNIEGGQQQRSHLVAMANIAHSAPTAPGQSQWYLFNDFHVKPIPPQEALTFNTSWKTPSVITYQTKSANNQLDSSWKQNLDSRLLYLDLQADRADKTYRTLDRQTEPAGPDTIVAIDTEFVKISQPEVEMHSDGDSKIIRPTVHALARNSIVRGSGMDEGVPFIDDYITIKEKVVDYLTSYSGITPEDLDITTAQQRGHNLVPLKIAYKKIWILLNLGCKFLGHGLKQDFRVINIHVPKAQVIDTSDLFFIKERLRKLSLQFLAHTLLKEDIQLSTHDSIEDARTALKLYRKYQEFSEAGVLDTMLQEIYAKGVASNFKPPAKLIPGGSVPRTDTPPVDGTITVGPTTPSRKPSSLVPGTPASTPGRGLGSR